MTHAHPCIVPQNDLFLQAPQALAAQYSKLVHKDNHPSNGWFPQRLKAYITGQRLKALAFTMFKPIAFATFAAP